MCCIYLFIYFSPAFLPFPAALASSLLTDLKQRGSINEHVLSIIKSSASSLFSMINITLDHASAKEGTLTVRLSNFPGQGGSTTYRSGMLLFFCLAGAWSTWCKQRWQWNQLFSLVQQGHSRLHANKIAKEINGEWNQEVMLAAVEAACPLQPRETTQFTKQIFDVGKR